MTYLEIAQKVLQDKNIKIPLTHLEIWEQAIKKGYGKDKIGKTPEASLGAHLFVNVRDKKDSKFIKIGSRPTRFWLKTRKDEISEFDAKIEVVQKQEIKNKQKGFLESDLHPLLVNFLYYDERFNLYCKTINANTSKNSNKGLNEWIHPDIVGIHFPFAFDDFEKNTLDLLQNLSKPNYKIYSFEIKKFINNANLKECYFQAVSNSSWANEGYLVAFEIKDDDEVKNELARLNLSFGIGVIELKTSKVKFEAKNKELDLDTLDMLVRKNKDFREFIENVNKDINKYKIDPEIKKDKYDEVLNNDEELVKYIKDKHINHY